MRAVSLSNRVDMNRVVKIVADLLEGHAREHGSLKDSVLVLTVQACSDSDGGHIPRIESRTESVT
jgi:hypothetical protein